MKLFFRRYNKLHKGGLSEDEIGSPLGNAAAKYVILEEMEDQDRGPWLMCGIICIYKRKWASNNSALTAFCICNGLGGTNAQANECHRIHEEDLLISEDEEIEFFSPSRL